jgi:hypothetical protein
MIKIILYLILIAACHAKMERTIESDEGGWGKNLPCKKIEHPILILIIGKHIMQYHLWMLILFILIFHIPFIFIDWSIKKELIVLGLYCLYWVIEDFMWFVESKDYGIMKLFKKECEWHKRYTAGLPRSYFYGLIMGFLLLIIGYFL